MVMSTRSRSIPYGERPTIHASSLTEFFVLPDHQSRGIGRALIERAFPAGRGNVRSIIATSDVRAQARYYAAGAVACARCTRWVAFPGRQRPSTI
jgi:GNAT superfamily N-acetyltransferase